MPNNEDPVCDFLAGLTDCREIADIIAAIGRKGSISLMDERLLEMHCQTCKKCEAKLKAVSKS